MSAFVTLDSGNREEFSSGMVRDVDNGKPDYTFTLQGPMLRRWAELLQRGADKYTRDNWMKAAGDAELQRFRQSALRHMIQWLQGDTNEDHAAAVFFNINGACYVEDQQRQSTVSPQQLCDRCNLNTPTHGHKGSDGKTRGYRCATCTALHPCCSFLRPLSDL